MRKKSFRKNQHTQLACQFCVERATPDYKQVEVISRFTSDRGKIIARSRTGLCREHQRLLTVAVKRARHLALLPFIPSVQ